ncbi:hypothetical protein BJ912DRAFT_148677 [Pholiota molesta]|nr:hypothetical protein BJ912DRAFT_148677 [Pholiota molesta]
MGNLLQLECLPLDIIFEILGHLSVEDIVRTRRACRRLWQVTYQRNVWVSIYERSNLLLPEGPFPSQCEAELESHLVRAAKLDHNLTSSRPIALSRRRFPRILPAYDFDANVISGRYLQLAERNSISWYDLDSGDMSKPILNYPCATVAPIAGYLKYQTNANGEGQDTAGYRF